VEEAGSEAGHHPAGNNPEREESAGKPINGEAQLPNGKTMTMHEMDYTVTLTAKDLAFRERARSAGIPSMLVSMYAGALQRLVEDEREECAKVAAAWQTDVLNPLYHCDCATAIRARGEK
jgi:hypothetical protein